MGVGGRCWVKVVVVASLTLDGCLENNKGLVMCRGPEWQGGL